MKTFGSALLTTLLVVCLSGPLTAQQLSMQRYNAASGLAHDQVTSLLEDSRGYLWIGTFEGLSRFDGSTFVSYGLDDGIANYLINDLAEDRQGRLWVATNGGGVAVLDDRRGASPVFTSYEPASGAAANVNVIVVDTAGRLWCGTDGGVFVADITGAVPAFKLVGFSRHAAVDAAVHGDRVWMAVNGAGLVEFRDDIPTLHPAPEPLRNIFQTLVADGRDGVLVGSDTGFYRFSAGRFTPMPVDLRPGQVVVDALDDGMGGLWLATTQGLVHHTGGTSRRYSLDRAVGGWLTSVLVDRGGNVWVGLGQAGIVQIRSQQIISYTAVDGLPDTDVTALIEDERGTIYGITRSGRLAAVSDEGVTAHPGVSISGHRALVRSPDGWWALGRDGVYHIPGSPPRFDRARRVTPSIRTTSPVPSSVPLVQIDDRRRILFAGSDPALYAVADLAAADPRLDRWPLSVPGDHGVGVLGVDRAGGTWLANMTTLARFADGRLTLIDPQPGLPNVQPRALFVDRRGGVWIGLRFGGVLYTNDPSAARPRFVRYGLADGLASDAVWAITEDRDGRIYLGTGRGLDQLDPSTRLIRHFTTDDGLAGNFINSLLTDANGTVWVAAMGGVSRLDLGFAPARAAPIPIYVSGVQLAGVTHPLPPRGASQVGELQLRGGSRNLRIDFVTPAFQHPGRIRYQYMLEGVDAQWSQPVVERTVNYATLSPGRYRFRVKAITADGRSSEVPATVDFVIDPPFWAQPWFMAVVFAGMFAGVLSVQRLHEQRRRSLSAIRRQVATDLHDDMGSGLSQIAILSEVAKRTAGAPALPTLNEVADLARSLRDSMSDIVWAIDPDRDEPRALVERMRQVTFNLLPSGAEVTFRAPEDRVFASLDLGPDRRRHLLLIFKEAITNIARHAQATSVSIDLEAEGTRLRLTIRDNGVGFDVVRRYSGHGLENLAARSRAMGAEIEIRSRPGDGSVITLIVPLRRRPRMFRWLPSGKRRG